MLGLSRAPYAGPDCSGRIAHERSPPAAAEDWPQFRGPTGQGISTETGLPLEWSESQNVRWKTAVPGTGWSSPVVADGRVWLTTAVVDRNATTLRALAFDAASGRQIVDVEVFRLPRRNLLNPKNSHASPTPIVEGDRVYVHFGADGTAALTTAGEVVWRKRFPYESQHGNGGSPMLYKDLLIFNCDGSDTAFVVALDKRTGAERWKTHRRAPADQAYSTPLVIRVGDRDQLISVGAYRAAPTTPTGQRVLARRLRRRLLKRAAAGLRERPRLHRHRLPGAVADRGAPRRSRRRDPDPRRVDASALRAAHAVAARRRRRTVHRHDLGIATCLDGRTGETHWRERLGGNHSASPVFADGRIYFLSEEGVATVIAPGQQFQKLATNTLDGGTLASMAVADGSIFIRTDSALYRLGIRPEPLDASPRSPHLR